MPVPMALIVIFSLFLSLNIDSTSSKIKPTTTIGLSWRLTQMVPSGLVKCGMSTIY